MYTHEKREQGFLLTGVFRDRLVFSELVPNTGLTWPILHFFSLGCVWLQFLSMGGC